MRNTISSKDARARFSDLVGRASFAKERTTVTRNGKPVAALVPIEDLAILEALEDEADVRAARRAVAEMKRKGEKPIPLSKVKKELGI